MKDKIYRLLDPGEVGSKANLAASSLIVLLIIINAVISILETVPGFSGAYEQQLFWFEAFSIAVFSVEYLLRLWSCTSTGRSPVLGRLRYAMTPMMLIDLVAILPFFLLFIDMDLRVARMIRLTRIFRIAKLARHSKALQLLGSALWFRRDELLITLIVGFFALILSSTAIFYAENGAQPEQFSSIPASLWWAVSTLTTVGYGDMYPVTLVGKLLGGIVQVLGVGLFALPAGILASAFLEEIQARKSESAESPEPVPPANCPHCGKPIDG